MAHIMQRFEDIIGSMTTNEMREALSFLISQMPNLDIIEVLRDVLSEDQRVELAP